MFSKFLRPTPAGPSRSRESERSRCAIALIQLALCLSPYALASCGETDAAPREVPVEREIRDLLTALRPLAANAGHAVQGDWYRRRDLTLTRLRASDREVGAAARAAYEERVDDPVALRAGLLDVAAHADPEGTLPILEELFTTYGPDILLRREAAVLLGEVAPERAIELLEPVVLKPLRTTTYPPNEFMLTSLLKAKRTLGQPLEELLTILAVDIYQEDRVRQLAVEELGKTETPRGLKALEAVLIESTGNAFLRREAAQALLLMKDREAVCATFRTVFDREADGNFRVFLNDVINKNCR